MVVMELVVLRQSFAKHYGGGGVGGGEGCARPGVRLPSHPSTIYRGKGEGERPLRSHLVGGAAATGKTLDGFGRPHP